MPGFDTLCEGNAKASTAPPSNQNRWSPATALQKLPYFRLTVAGRQTIFVPISMLRKQEVQWPLPVLAQTEAWLLNPSSVLFLEGPRPLPGNQEAHPGRPFPGMIFTYIADNRMQPLGPLLSVQHGRGDTGHSEQGTGLSPPVPAAPLGFPSHFSFAPPGRIWRVPPTIVSLEVFARPLGRLFFISQTSTHASSYHIWNLWTE